MAATCTQFDTARFCQSQVVDRFPLCQFHRDRPHLRHSSSVSWLVAFHYSVGRTVTLMSLSPGALFVDMWFLSPVPLLSVMSPATVMARCNSFGRLVTVCSCLRRSRADRVMTPVITRVNFVTVRLMSVSAVAVLLSDMSAMTSCWSTCCAPYLNRRRYAPLPHN